MHELKSALRETLRTTVLALIPVVIAQIQAQDINPTLIGISLSIGLLRGLDKWLKETENPASKFLSFDMIK